MEAGLLKAKPLAPCLSQRLAIRRNSSGCWRSAQHDCARGRAPLSIGTTKRRNRSFVCLLCARQPLAAIMMNVDSADRLLPDMAEDGLRSALADTREAAQHAIDVIGRLGMLLKAEPRAHSNAAWLASAADATNKIRPMIGRTVDSPDAGERKNRMLG